MIYVSYSQKDRPIVQRFCHSLTEKGVQLHVDYEQMVGGNFVQELTKQIESAEAILFFYSENTENSMWVKHEIEFSLSKNKHIIPLLLSEPDKSSWIHYYLGSFNWIKANGESINSVADRIINVISQSYKRNDDVLFDAKINIDERSLANSSQSNKLWVRFAKKRKFGCGIIMIISLIALFLFFALFYVGIGNRNLSYSSNPSSCDTISYSNMVPEQMDSLIFKQREAELRNQIDDQMSRLMQEISNPYFAGHSNYSQSIIREIESVLGESIPFPQDSINTRQGQLKAFRQYQETVYSVLDRRIAEMESKLKEVGYSDNKSFQGSQTDNKQREKYAVAEEGYSDNDTSIWILMFISFLVGGGLMFLLFKVRIYKQNNIKLSSDIASKISIDGDLKKEIGSREVYTTYLDRGEYLIDFEDKQDKNRHKTFNHEVTTKECKLVFANFLEESSQKGKTIKCFIAGSKALQQERDALRAVTCVMYNKWDSKDFRILSYTFEDFKKEHTLVPPQELYNKFIEEEADWALFIIDGEVGGITVDEYRVAMDSFKKNGSPKILALAKVGSESNEKVAEIRYEINKEHQYWTDYTDIVSLKYIFESTLNWDLIRMFQE